MSVFLEYFIDLTDEALVATLQATPFRRGVFNFYGEPGHPIMAPDDAALEWNAPIQLANGYSPKVGPPCTRSDYFTTEYNYPRNETSFQRRKSGVFGWILSLFGAGKTTFYWRATFVYAGAPAGESPVPGEVLTAIPQRRWLDGFELPDRGEAAPPAVAPTGTGTRACREASRHVQGFGWLVDSQSGTRTHAPTDAGGPATNAQWERVYLRPRRFGATPTRIWRCFALGASPAEGIVLELLPSGQIAVSNVSATFVLTAIGTTTAPLVAHAWHKLDLIFNYRTAAPLAGDFLLYVNGVEVFHAPAPAGLSTIQNIGGSVLGPDVNHTAALEFDDWIGAVQPAASHANRDWHMGSRVAWLGAQAFAADSEVTWLGDWRLLRQRINDPAAQQVVTSVTSSARLSVVVDAGREVDQEPNGRGIVALMVALFASRAGVANGTLGYKLPGGADVLAAITQTGALAWNSVYYLPTGLLEPITPLKGLEVKHVKGAAIDASSVFQLGAIAEVIGLFGPEDAVTLTAAQLGTPAAIAAQASVGSVELVASIKAGLVARGISLAGACGAFEITKRVAWALRASGAGLLEKLTGNKCENRATDIVMFGAGKIMDVLIDGGGANTPSWNVGTPVEASRFRAATDPGDTAPPAAWDAATAYAVGDRVTVASSSYRCLVAHTNQTPPNTTYWAPEGPPPGDGTIVAPIPPHTGIHNAPYPRTPWARGSVAPLSPVVMVTGSYVGTGTLLDLLFTCPIHFLWIRPVTGGTGGAQWWSSMLSAHKAGGEERGFPSLCEISLNPDFAGATAVDTQEQQTVVRLAGNHADLNANGVTYSYLAISDPGMRFLIAGACQVVSTLTSYVNALGSETFTPEAVFFQHELIGGGGTLRLGYKGPGHAASGSTPAINGAAEVASTLSFGLGTLTSSTAFFPAASGAAQSAYVAFRRDDGSGDVGIPRVLQLATYVGDGSASRTLSLAPASGRRPMWGMVIPHSAVAAIYRDPAHTGTTSTGIPNTANAATGITAGGIDQITVGIGLNANGVVYDVFVIPGCDGAAGNGGWSTACETVPVEPTTPNRDPWGDEPTDPETPGPTEPGGGTEPGGDDTDFGTDCVVASTKVINQALARLGIGKRVDDIVAEQSEEAATARLLYSDDVSATLRDYPWPFATRYAQLVWVAGSATAPVNGDWTYAYRAPDNMMFARRIVARGGAQRRFDGAPIDFRIGSDPLGPLIYTNQADAGLTVPTSLTVELEYTIRLTCAASSGDAIFRSALAWRHAHSLAPILSRDEKKIAFCWSMYQHVLGQASTKAAQETQQPPAGEADWIRGRE